MREIFFYVPSARIVASLPDKVSDYWQWINEVAVESPALLPQGSPCTWLGPYNWTIQTFLYLKEYFICKLTDSLPEEGIVISHSDFLPPLFKPSPKQFVVEIKPDRILNCAFANFVIVQNKQDPLCKAISNLFIDSAFVYYWPQPGLIPRDRNRGDVFSNVCFLGNRRQFLVDIDDLNAKILRLGLRFSIVPRENWHDYSNIDAVIAVRELSRHARSKRKPPVDTASVRKPASKLSNAWLAGVPAILSADPAFKEMKVSDLDYLEANNIDEIVDRLEQLKLNPELRKAMVAHGRQRAASLTPDDVAKMWMKVLSERILPSHDLWLRSTLRRHWHTISRTILSRVLPGILRK